MDGRQLLISTPAGSLFPERNHIISVWSSDTLSTAFKKMISNNILSVPVYDQVRRNYTHFLDMVDVVAFAVSQVNADPTTPHTTDPKQLMDVPILQTVTCGKVADLSKRNPFFPVESGAPLLEALNLMVKWKVHRIPIVDAEGELITIISQSQLSSFVYKYLSSFSPSLMQKTAISISASIASTEQSSPDTPVKVISVELKDRAIDAFITMHEKRISGVAVVNESGTIVGNISASDLKAIGYDGELLTRLFYPVSEFLRLIHPANNDTNTALDERPEAFAAPLVVPTTATFGSVLGSLINTHIHRVYVVDQEGHPVGVIGYAEILRAVQAEIPKDATYRDNTLYF